MSSEKSPAPSLPGYVVLPVWETGGKPYSLPPGYKILVPRFGVPQQAGAGYPMRIGMTAVIDERLGVDAGMATGGRMVAGYEIVGIEDISVTRASQALGSIVSEETTLSDEEWDEAKDTALRQISADRLAPPDEHLATIRALIKTAVARHVV